MDNGELFEKAIDFICLKENIDNPKAVPYRLRVYTAWAGIPIKYHPEKINKYTKIQVVTIAFHEIGHFVYTKGDRIQREYLAEKFSIQKIKKYFPKHYKSALQFTKDLAKLNIKYYSVAFNRVVQEEEDEG